MGSVVLPHLVTGWHVDQAIMSEEERLVVIRFGRDWDPDCMKQDEVLYRIADRVKNFAVIYVCDLDQVPDFKQMYELYDPVTLMFFFRNKHMMCDFGTGNNNKLNWVLEDKQELIDIVETIYRGAKKGRGSVRRFDLNVLKTPLIERRINSTKINVAGTGSPKIHCKQRQFHEIQQVSAKWLLTSITTGRHSSDSINVGSLLGFFYQLDGLVFNKGLANANRADAGQE
ncbi:MAG: U4/U6-U5 snRNP complex subunit dib1 [Phylliscum demangeonii]|nr:MAG: U4/U6-U5 snRNP complex subunit dib1 [Phylliscum demangeonii]